MASNLPMPALVVVSVILGIVNVAIIFGNGLVVVAFLRNHQLRVTRNYYIFNLAITDLLIGVFSVPFYSPTLWFGSWPFGTVFCVIWTVVDVTASTTATYALLLISYDRYTLVKDPLKYKTSQTTNVATLRIVICWLVAFLARAPFVVFGELWFSREKDKGASCQPRYPVEVPFVIGLRTYDIIYTSLSTILEWALPLVLIVYWNAKVYSKIRVRSRRNTISHLIANTMTGVQLAANVVTPAPLPDADSSHTVTAAVHPKPARKLAFIQAANSNRVEPCHETVVPRFHKQKSVGTISCFSRTSESRRLSLNELSKELQSYHGNDDNSTPCIAIDSYANQKTLTVKGKNLKSKTTQKQTFVKTQAADDVKVSDLASTSSTSDRKDSAQDKKKSRDSKLNDTNHLLPGLDSRNTVIAKECLTIIYTNMTVTAHADCEETSLTNGCLSKSKTRILKRENNANTRTNSQLDLTKSKALKHANQIINVQSLSRDMMSDQVRSVNKDNEEMTCKVPARKQLQRETTLNDLNVDNSADDHQVEPKPAAVYPYQKKILHKKKAVLTISLIIGMFIIFKTPYQMALLTMAACPQLGNCVPRQAYEAVLWIYWIKSVFNPFLYAFISKTFRQYCLQIFQAIRKTIKRGCITGCWCCQKKDQF